MPHGGKSSEGGPKDEAVGIPAITSSLGFSWEEMGWRRGLRALRHLNQVDGFDCPSCAWPDPDPGQRKLAEFCENGARALAWEATRARVDRDFFAAHSVGELRGFDDHDLEKAGRLTEPMYLAPGATHYRPIAFEDAVGLVAERLRSLADPNRAVFYTSGRASNEAAFVYQLLARRLGTNNLPDCSNMCHESSGAALTETLGVGKGLVSLRDITDDAALIIIAGQNPGTNHPRMLSALEQAKRRGGRIVALNPLPEAGFGRFRNPQSPRGLLGRGTQIADRLIQVRLDGDLALFAGLNRILLERDDVRPGSVLDRDFISRYCEGFEEAAAAWRTVSFADVEALSGVSRGEIEWLADEVERADSIVVCWAMGLTQHENAVATIREIVNFLLLRGNIGRPGAGPSPIRGHSNVQGDRTMGIWERMPEDFLRSLGEEFGFSPPREPGYDTVGAITAMRRGEVEVFVGLGGNFVAAAPDTEATQAAMANCGLTVQISTKLNRSHLYHGREALILPCLARSERDVRATGEQFVSVEDSMSMVHASRGRLEPVAPGLQSEVGILTALGWAIFGDDLGWREMGDDYRVIRAHIERVAPGFHAFEARVGRPGGFELPRPPRDLRRFPTPSGRARFTVNPPTAPRVPDGYLLLQTLRAHDQFNTTVYGRSDRYRGIEGTRRVVLVNREDLARQGLTDGAVVDVVSEWTDGERRARGFRAVAYPTPPGCAAAYFPEANVLVPLDHTAAISNTPVSKSVVVRLEPVEQHEPTRPAPT